MKAEFSGHGITTLSGHIGSFSFSLILPKKRENVVKIELSL